MDTGGSERATLTAAEAAAELNVSRATLYAYVSRGLLRSEPVPGSRSRLYRADDVRRLRARPEPGEPLSWGEPVLASAITLIAGGRLYYRGRDAAALAVSASVEAVARLLWQQNRIDPFAAPPPRLPALPAGLAGLPLCQAVLPVAASADLPAFNLAPAGVAATGARVLRLMTTLLAGADTGAEARPIEAQLRRGWGADTSADPVLRAALILCADHELNPSAFAARVVASTGATPYAAVQAGLAALQGPRHGGATAQVAAFLDQIAPAAAIPQQIARRLERGEPLPGFGHPLYPEGDLRARLLLDLAEAAAPGSDRLHHARAVASATAALTGQTPNIDFALVAAARALGLPAAAPLGLFAIGRCVGWIAHAQEQYGEPGVIRPRARYRGDPPKPSRADQPVSAARAAP
ncbi:MAG: citrate/2-methylcitrate synthase [Alphaproteobacteria bacterium]